LQFADSLINKKRKDDKYFEDVNAIIKLKDQLGRYSEIVKQGGWSPWLSQKVASGITAPEIAH
jgi:hypothetical protein